MLHFHVFRLVPGGLGHWSNFPACAGPSLSSGITRILSRKTLPSRVASPDAAQCEGARRLRDLLAPPGRLAARSRPRQNRSPCVVRGLSSRPRTHACCPSFLPRFSVAETIA